MTDAIHVCQPGHEPSAERATRDRHEATAKRCYDDDNYEVSVRAVKAMLKEGGGSALLRSSLAARGVRHMSRGGGTSVEQTLAYGLACATLAWWGLKADTWENGVVDSTWENAVFWRVR